MKVFTASYAYTLADRFHLGNFIGEVCPVTDPSDPNSVKIFYMELGRKIQNNLKIRYGEDRLPEIYELTILSVTRAEDLT